MKFIFFANNPDISFGKQAEILINELRKMGHSVIFIEHNSLPKLKQRAIELQKPDVVVVWTYFHDTGHQTMSINELPTKRDFYLVGFEVSDTTKLSEKAIEVTKGLNPDVLITPSKWSSKGFGELDIPIAILPHALDYEIYRQINSKPKIVFPSLEDDLKKVYVFASHSPDRKGVDIVKEVLPDICTKYPIQVIWKTWGVVDKSVISMPCRVFKAIGHTSKLNHYTLMKSSTHFFYPVRGGSFEIPVLEMLALGKTVVVPEQGAWTEIFLDKNDGYFISVKGFKRYWTDNPYHVGEFVEPDVHDAKQKLGLSLQNPLNIDTKKYLEYYSPQNVTSMFLDLIRK